MKRIPYLQIAMVAALLVAESCRMPYGYYTLLKVICCSGFAYLAYKAHGKKLDALMWAFGVIAVVYNPTVMICFHGEPGERVMRFNGILSSIKSQRTAGRDCQPYLRVSVPPCENCPPHPLRSLCPLREEIDSIVYKLYGLTDDEIAVVEKAVKK